MFRNVQMLVYGREYFQSTVCARWFASHNHQGTLHCKMFDKGQILSQIFGRWLDGTICLSHVHFNRSSHLYGEYPDLRFARETNIQTFYIRITATTLFKDCKRNFCSLCNTFKTRNTQWLQETTLIMCPRLRISRCIINLNYLNSLDRTRCILYICVLYLCVFHVHV